MSDQAKRHQGTICNRKFNKSKTDVEIVDEFGVSIMYDAVLNDLVDLEKELQKIGSYFIKQHEMIVDAEVKEPSVAIDRGEVTQDLLEMEHEYQYSKLRLIENYMECYEHTTDLVEQQRLVQIITDLMAKRPKLNFDSTYFKDSYRAEIESLELRNKLVREVIDHQIATEKDIITNTNDHLDKKLKLANDHMMHKWKYQEKKDNVEQIIEIEKEESDDGVDLIEKERLEKEKMAKKARLDKIAQRHITEYTNNYD